MNLRRVARQRRMALALFGACVGLACQDGYPIAPTQCDVWCEQELRADCGIYDPASCVVACEKEGVGRAECANFVALAVACLQKKTDQELDCVNWSYPDAPCVNEQAAALQCGSTGGQGAQGTN